MDKQRYRPVLDSKTVEADRVRSGDLHSVGQRQRYLMGVVGGLPSSGGGIRSSAASGNIADKQRRFR